MVEHGVLGVLQVFPSLREGSVRIDWLHYIFKYIAYQALDIHFVYIA